MVLSEGCRAAPRKGPFRLSCGPVSCGPFHVNCGDAAIRWIAWSITLRHASGWRRSSCRQAGARGFSLWGHRLISRPYFALIPFVKGSAPLREQVNLVDSVLVKCRIPSVGYAKLRSDLRFIAPGARDSGDLRYCDPERRRAAWRLHRSRHDGLFPGAIARPA